MTDVQRLDDGTRGARARDPMPVVVDAADTPDALAAEIRRRVAAHHPGGDSFFYNGTTIVALLLTGAATVLANVDATLASICSALAAFAIALSRTLNFGGRWRWHLQRQGHYSALAYQLNAISLLPEAERPEAYRALYTELGRQRLLDAAVPGSGEEAATATAT